MWLKKMQNTEGAIYSEPPETINSIFEYARLFFAYFSALFYTLERIDDELWRQ
jgi:hypothetical protein